MFSLQESGLVRINSVKREAVRKIQKKSVVVI